MTEAVVVLINLLKLPIVQSEHTKTEIHMVIFNKVTCQQIDTRRVNREFCFTLSRKYSVLFTFQILNSFYERVNEAVTQSVPRQH